MPITNRSPSITGRPGGRGRAPSAAGGRDEQLVVDRLAAGRDPVQEARNPPGPSDCIQRSSIVNATGALGGSSSSAVSSAEAGA